MTDILKIKECSGFTKEEAFKDLKFNPDCPLIKGSNATQAWIKYGQPFPGTMEFKRFASQQLTEKTKLQPGYGLHIVLETPTVDTRKRPYTIINNKTETTREWSFVYFIREDELELSTLPTKDIDEYGDEIEGAEEIDVSIVKMGRIVDQCDSKAKAIQRMKDLTSKNHKDYSALAVKVPDVNPIAAYSVYTPGANTKEGKFIAFGIDAEV